MEKVTASYIVRFFPRALSELERKALNHYMHTSKLDGNISQQILGATPRGGANDLYDGDDYYYAFGSYEEALEFSEGNAGAEEPLALVLQEDISMNLIPVIIFM